MQLSNQHVDFSLLGQCSFTYIVLENLLKDKLTPGCVLIEKSEVDYDPFNGLAIDKHSWFEGHKLYHGKWFEKIKDLCQQNDIQLVVGLNVIERLEVSDVLVVAGYANKVPSNVLSNYNGWAINVHPSILPMFKGPQPEAQMILCDNYDYAGVTIHEITDVWDSGKIYWQRKLDFDSSLTVGKMEAIEASLACVGLRKLFQDYPVIDDFDALPVSKSSYYSWYSDSILALDKTFIENGSSTCLFRLRPEGYAYISTAIGVFYPIIDFANEEKKNLLERAIGSVLKSDHDIKYLCKEDTVKFIKELRL